MKASSRSKLIVPIVSVVSMLALSAHAQDAGRTAGEPAPGHKPPPPAVRTAPSPPQAARIAPPSQQTSRGAPPVASGQSRVGAGGPPPQAGSRVVARGQAPMRDFGGQRYRGRLAWEGGRWRHESHNGQFGWWWDVGGAWYYYPEPMDGPPTYISEEYVDDIPVAYAPSPPPVAYEPPPPPPPADPGASALGGALVGGLLGGLISGNATGAAAGAILGGATGAIAGATEASRPGYYVAEGNCYYRYPNGQYVLADPRACY